MENSISSDLIRGHIDTIILRTISPADKNSQEIMDEISYKSDGKYELKQATLYSALKRLENDNYIKAYWQDCSDGGRRRFYKLLDKGRALINKNLSDWMFSRAIIDTLVQADPYNSTIFKGALPKAEPVEIIKEVEVVKEVVKTEPVIQSVQATITPEKEPDSNVLTPEKSEKDVKIADEYTQELNFRYILNGLIKTSTLDKREHESPVKEQEIVNSIKEEPQVVQSEPQLITDQLKETRASFSYEISKYNSAKDTNSDFSDLVEDCERSNLKVRVSMQRHNKVSTGILINHVKLISSLMIYILVALEILFLYVSKNDILPKWFPILIALTAIFPIISFINYKQNPSKTIYRYLSAKNVILMAFIALFDIALLNVVGYVFIIGIDGATATQSMYFLTIPILLYIDIFVYFVIRSTFISNSRFRVSAKEIQ